MKRTAIITTFGVIALGLLIGVWLWSKDAAKSHAFDLNRGSALLAVIRCTEAIARFQKENGLYPFNSEALKQLTSYDLPQDVGELVEVLDTNRTSSVIVTNTVCVVSRQIVKDRRFGPSRYVGFVNGKVALLPNGRAMLGAEINLTNENEIRWIGE